MSNITLEDLRPAAGSTSKIKRVGRGRSSGRGKTSCRGHNGEGQRSGNSSKRGFEGGQMPAYRRLPKLKGFQVYSKDNYAQINVGRLDALKLKEITYIHGEGYAAGELKHGPLALIDEGIPVVVVIPPGDTYKKTMSNLEEVKSRGAYVLAVGSSDDESLKAKANDVIAINSDVKEIIAPLVYIVPLQLIAYYITLEKGHDPDKPKNLAKCVTVE